MNKRFYLLVTSLVAVTALCVIALAAGQNQTATQLPSMQVQLGDNTGRAACSMNYCSTTMNSYFSGFSPGMINVSYFNPANFCAAPYPFEITAFSFTLLDYDPTASIWPAVLDVVVFDGSDSCSGPGVELCRFTVSADSASYALPNVGTVWFPTPCCVSGPFYIGLEYTAGGSAGTNPSICYDDSPPPDSCLNWFLYQGTWYEWYEIWNQPGPNFPMFWVDGETQSANCGQSPCDWNVGDEYKMHFPQLPNEEGWDVNATFPSKMADDFECIESGYIKDVHFWGSWKDGQTGVIDSFGLSLHTNITEQENPDGYSMPGDLLWSYTAHQWTQEEIFGQYVEGWIDPITGEVLTDNHQDYFQYNICLEEPYWFWQDAGTIYWLDITAYLPDGSAETWGWKTSIEQFMDDAVYLGEGTCQAPWNAAGTVDLPADCPYVDVDSPMMIIDGLPPGTDITCDPTLDSYRNQMEYPGGSLGGDIHEFDADLHLAMTGSGDLAGYTRNITMEVHVEIHTAPRTLGDPLQVFAADLWALDGIVVGDPDFDYLEVQAGSAYSLPSPGQFTIEHKYEIDPEAWIESFFDVYYQLPFTGAPGGPLEGLSGMTRLVSHWQQGGSGWQELREPVLEQDWLGNTFYVEVDQFGNVVGGGGEGAFGDGWYFYPWYDWWNIWFYDHPYDPTRYKEVHFDVEFVETGPGAYVEFALNWSTDRWSIDQPVGDSAPPLPGADEDLYIGRAILYSGPVIPGPMPFDFVIPDYNPEWVSVDIRGFSYYIPQGIISHSCTGYSLSGQSLDLAFVITGGPPEQLGDSVKCEPQGDQNPMHPPTYWYDVTPGGGTGRCDFHVLVQDSNPYHYTNWVEPAGWTHELHQVGADWWVSWYNPGCANAIFSTFRFSFDNPYMSTLGDWRTTIDGSNDPYAQVVDSAENHAAELDGYGYRVHVPFFELPDIDSCTYYKQPWPDYAPAGMPDFDQKQNGWFNAASGQWSYCGPVALGNCFWWFDSKFETIPMVPPAISDNYPLVTAYGPWDDHYLNNVIPFIDTLAATCNTDVGGTGTSIADLTNGAITWLTAAGLDDEYTVNLIPGHDPAILDLIRDEVLRSQDVILLLGFWDQQPTGECWRAGGHYVTVAGVCEDEQAFCFSDPWYDMHEGEPPAGAAHPAAVHNDAQWISGPHGTIFHDKYSVGASAPACGPYDKEVFGYPISPSDIANFQFTNEGEFPNEGYQGGDIRTLIEFALIICPIECDAIIGEADNSGAIDIDDVVYLIAYIFSGGPAPSPYAVASGDADCSCAVDIDDVVYLIAYIFSGGPAPCTCEEWVAACGTLH